MIKINKFGFPVVEMPDPAEMAKAICSVQPMQTQLFKQLLDSLTPNRVEMVQDFEIKVGDVVDFLDPLGCFVSKAEVLKSDGEIDGCAKVRIAKFDIELTVRKSDLLKLVPAK